MPGRNRWGDTVSREFIIPAKVYRVRGLLADAEMSERLTVGKGGNVLELTAKSDPLKDSEITPNVTYQFGSLSASANDTYILADSMPVLPLCLLRHSTWQRNVSKPNDSLLFRHGSILRLNYAESLFAPIKKSDGLYPSYTVKFYIDYTNE